jgi:hypothetical protein
MQRCPTTAALRSQLAARNGIVLLLYLSLFCLDFLCQRQQKRNPSSKLDASSAYSCPFGTATIYVPGKPRVAACLKSQSTCHFLLQLFMALCVRKQPGCYARKSVMLKILVARRCNSPSGIHSPGRCRFIPGSRRRRLVQFGLFFPGHMDRRSCNVEQS